jgi:adenylate kinase family enzyme
MNGPRVCIIGNSGSGKSTLAKALAEELSVPVYYLDRYMMGSGFDKLPREKRISVHADLIRGDSWVIDGNFKRMLADRIRRATLVVFLDIGRFITVPRILKRTLGGARITESVPEGANLRLLSFEHLKWAVEYNRQERIQYLKKECKENNVPLLLLKRATVREMVGKIKKELG